VNSSRNLGITTADYLLAASYYVAYRTQNPDAQAVADVEMELKNNNISSSSMVAFQANHCKTAEYYAK
jgi:hypothetical protein